MKKLVGKQKNCFISMAILIVLCEILLRIDNRIIQLFGVCLTPIIIMFGFMLLKNDQKKSN